jgi:hypothetical protein
MESSPFAESPDSENLVKSRKELLAQFQQASTAKLSILWGSPGSGKSWCLRQIESYQVRQQKSCAHLDFEELAGVSTEQLTNSLIRLWAISLNLDVSGQPENFDQTVKQIIERAKNSPTTFLIDNLDCLLKKSEDVFYWLERVLIAPLMVVTGSLIIATSSLPIQRQWRDFETRRRSQTIHLQPFTKDDIAILLNSDNPEMVQFAYEATAGHPKAIEWLMKMVGQNKTQY